MTLSIGIFQLHGKSELKQVKVNKIKQDMYRSDSIFPYLQSVTLFKGFLKFISWSVLPQKWMITLPQEKRPSFNFVP